MKYRNIMIFGLCTALTLSCTGTKTLADVEEDRSAPSTSKESYIDVTNYGITPNTEGTTSGNLVNGGFLAVQGKWTYFALPGTRTNHYSLFRSMNDCETGLKPLKEYSGKRCLNVVRQWVYYIDSANNSSIYRTKTDGSKTELIVEGNIENFFISEGFLYYLKMENFKEFNAEITRFDSIMNQGINTEIGIYKYEGIFKLKLQDQEYGKDNSPAYHARDPIAEGHFFQQLFAYNKKLYAIAMDITEANKTTETLYSMDLDGSNLRKVSSDFIFNPIFYKDHIYYTLYDDYTTKLYRIDLNGANKTKISNNDIYSFNIADDWIYYAPAANPKNILKMRLDGTSLSPVTSHVSTGMDSGSYDAISSIYIVDDSIFYFGRSDSYKFRRVSTDGALDKVIN